MFNKDRLRLAIWQWRWYYNTIRLASAPSLLHDVVLSTSHVKNIDGNCLYPFHTRVIMCKTINDEVIEMNT